LRASCKSPQLLRRCKPKDSSSAQARRNNCAGKSSGTSRSGAISRSRRISAFNNRALVVAQKVEMSYRLGVDIGGTFTDLVIQSDTGRIHTVKVPTTPDDPSQAVLNAIELAAGEEIGITLAD